MTRDQDLRPGQMRLIDLSVALEHDAAGEMLKPKIVYVTPAPDGVEPSRSCRRSHEALALALARLTAGCPPVRLPWSVPLTPQLLSRGR